MMSPMMSGAASSVNLAQQQLQDVLAKQRDQMFAQQCGHSVSSAITNGTATLSILSSAMTSPPFTGSILNSYCMPLNIMASPVSNDASSSWPMLASDSDLMPVKLEPSTVDGSDLSNFLQSQGSIKEEKKPDVEGTTADDVAKAEPVESTANSDDKTSNDDMSSCFLGQSLDAVKIENPALQKPPVAKKCTYANCNVKTN